MGKNKVSRVARLKTADTQKGVVVNVVLTVESLEALKDAIDIAAISPRGLSQCALHAEDDTQILVKFARDNLTLDIDK